jgi:hypothetical protein
VVHDERGVDLSAFVILLPDLGKVRLDELVTEDLPPELDPWVDSFLLSAQTCRECSGGMAAGRRQYEPLLRRSHLLAIGPDTPPGILDLTQPDAVYEISIEPDDELATFVLHTSGGDLLLSEYIKGNTKLKGLEDWLEISEVTSR